LKKILVTGGAGFIGGNFIQYMLDKYDCYELYNLDALTYAGDLTKHRQYEDNPRYHLLKVDLIDEIKINEVFERNKFDYVVHFAAESHVDRSIESPKVFTMTNVIGTQNILEASLRLGVSKFLHVSTDEVYGELDLDPTTFFTENTNIQPNSPYSASKAASDLMVRAYHETFGLPVNITRCSNNYGPYHFPEKLIPLTITRALEDKNIPIYGNGKNIRDWLHVKDHCSAIDLVLHKGENGEVYNIGGHNERTNLEVVEQIIDILGKDKSLISFVEDRKGHDKRYAIDPSKIEELGWLPIYNFDSGLRQTVDWYLQNTKWWESIVTGEYLKYFDKQYTARGIK
jgi:dTDP-glucose 4,6-dehydratase